jgi:hypothetical protein
MLESRTTASPSVTESRPRLDWKNAFLTVPIEKPAYSSRKSSSTTRRNSSNSALGEGGVTGAAAGVVGWLLVAGSVGVVGVGVVVVVAGGVVATGDAGVVVVGTGVVTAGGLLAGIGVVTGAVGFAGGFAGGFAATAGGVVG